VIEHVPLTRILKNDYQAFLLAILGPALVVGVALTGRSLASLEERRAGFVAAAAVGAVAAWFAWRRVTRIRDGLRRGQRLPATIASIWFHKDRGRLEYVYSYGRERKAGVVINKNADTTALAVGDRIDIVLDPQRPDSPLVVGLYAPDGFRSREAARDTARFGSPRT
jgi:hypothetical protein